MTRASAAVNAHAMALWFLFCPIAKTNRLKERGHGAPISTVGRDNSLCLFCKLASSSYSTHDSRLGDRQKSPSLSGDWEETVKEVGSRAVRGTKWLSLIHISEPTRLA